MKPKVIDSVQAQEPIPIIGILFKSFSNRVQVEIPKFGYTSIQEGIATLCIRTSMTREYLAKRLAMATDNLANLERRGRPVTQDQLHRLSRISHEMNLHELGEFFEGQELQLRYRQSKLGTRRSKSSVSGDDDFTFSE